MHKADVLLVRTPTFYGSLIRWWTGSFFNHVATVVGSGEIVEAEARGVQRVPLHYDAYIVLRRKGVTEEQGEQVAANALAQVGAPYDWGTIWALALKRFTGWRLFRAWAGHYDCVEQVQAAFRDAAPFPPVDTPGQFLSLAEFEKVDIVCQ